MARPTKNTVEYFPHFVNHGKTIFTLESMHGNDGYAVWFKLLELLGDSPGHSIDITDRPTWTYMLARFRVDEETALSILETLRDLNAIDPGLYSNGCIWSDNFVSGLSRVYSKRATETPDKPCFRHGNYDKEEFPAVSAEKTPQSKVKESKGKDNGAAEAPVEPLPRPRIPYSEIVSFLNEKAGAAFKPSSSQTRSLIKARFNEGFLIDDFRTVIEAKVAEWKGNDKMCAYLRPATLFSNKFEGYLQAAKTAPGKSNTGEYRCDRCLNNKREKCRNLVKPPAIDGWTPAKCGAFVEA